MKSAIHKTALPVLFGSLTAFCAWGEPTTLGFEECIALARQHNADLRISQSNLLAAEHRKRAAYGGYLPQLSGNASYTDSSRSTPSTGTTVGTSYSTGLTVTQNLFAGFQDEAKIEQGAASLESAQAALVSAKAQLSNDLKAGYSGLLYAQDNVSLTDNIRRRLEENLRLVELRFESGRENKGSYLLTRASLAQARFEHLQARQALNSAQAQLARVVGQAATDLRVTGSVPVSDTPPVPDFSELVRATPAIRDAVAKEKSASADVQLARGGFYPSVNVSGAVGRDGEHWAPDNSQRSVGASISIPLFSGGKDIYGVRAAIAALDAASASRESLERQLLVRLQQNYYTYLESIEKLKVDGEFMNAAETRAQIARAQYQNGLLSFQDWDRVEQDLIQRQKAFLASKRDRVTAEAAWELVQGKGVIP